jgi:hypothetical protein
MSAQKTCGEADSLIGIQKVLLKKNQVAIKVNNSKLFSNLLDFFDERRNFINSIYRFVDISGQQFSWFPISSWTVKPMTVWIIIAKAKMTERNK